MMSVVTNRAVPTKSVKTKAVSRLAKFKRNMLIFLILIGLPVIYLNVANLYFYYRLRSAGLDWPQYEPQYIIGDETKEKLSYVAMGDSLTAGVGVSGFNQTYSYLVAQQIQKPGKSIVLSPMATPGYKSNDLVDQYLDRAINLKPNIVTILIGVNDVHGFGPSPEEFRSNYEIMLRRLKSETSAEVYAIAIPYIGTNGITWPPYKNYYSSRTKTFNKNIRELANVYNTHYIDLYSATLQYSSEPTGYYSRDEFHPSAEGYANWARIIASDINN